MAYEQTWSQTVDTFFTATWSKRKESATLQAFLKTPFIYWLRQSGRIEFISGHRRIEVPVEYGDNETIRWIKKGSTVPLQQDELVTMTYEEWRYVSVTLMRYFQDDQQNRGKARMINYADLHLGAAERSLYEEFERVMFADGTGSEEPNGLQNLVDIDPTTGTVHGLNRATTPWWRNQFKQSEGSASLYLVKEMRTALNSILKYSKAELKDIALVTDQDTFELYEEEGYELVQLSRTGMFDAGFDTLTFRGRDLMWCPSAPSGRMYFLNTAYYKMICDEDYWMLMTDWKQIPNQPHDRVSQITCTFNVTCTRPVVCYVLYDISE
jgi:hypothetical protein